MIRFFLYPIVLNLFLPFTFEVNALPFFGDKCEQYKYSSSKLFKDKVNSVVVVTTSDAQGSGFVVKQDKEHTYILTNAHVVGSNKIVDIEIIMLLIKVYFIKNKYYDYHDNNFKKYKKMNIYIF